MTGRESDGRALGGGRTPGSGDRRGDREGWGWIELARGLAWPRPSVRGRGGMALCPCALPRVRSTPDSNRSSPSTMLARESGRRIASAAVLRIPRGALSADRRSPGAARRPHSRKHVRPMAITRPAGPTCPSGLSGCGRPAIEGFPGAAERAAWEGAIGVCSGHGRAGPPRGTRSGGSVAIRSGSVRMAMGQNLK
jgi:hypothetical protein